MKKIKFIYFNTLIIIFVSAFFSFAAETKNISKTVSPEKAVSDAATAPAQSQAKPVSADISTSLKPSPASAATNVTPESKASPVVTPAAVPAPPPPSQAISYSYNPVGKPDPFKSFIAIVDKKTPKATAAAGKKEKPLSIFPLQRAETNKYKVVGIVGNENKRMAIVEDASKKHYPLLIGTRIGLHNGKVAEILADRVIVEEYDEDNNKEKRVILKLRKN